MVLFRLLETVAQLAEAARPIRGKNAEGAV